MRRSLACILFLIMAAVVDSADLVDFLTNNANNSGYFSNLSLEDKLKIKEARRTPLLLMERKYS